MHKEGSERLEALDAYIIKKAEELEIKKKAEWRTIGKRKQATKKLKALNN